MTDGKCPFICTDPGGGQISCVGKICAAFKIDGAAYFYFDQRIRIPKKVQNSENVLVERNVY